MGNSKFDIKSNFKVPQMKAPNFGGSSGNPNALAERIFIQNMLLQNQLDAEKRKPGLAGETTEAQQQAKLRTRELSQDERSDLQVFDTVNKYATELESMMDTNPNRFQEAFAKANMPFDKLVSMGDQDAININRSLGDWADLVLRARSKSQTTEKEFGRIRSFGVPSLRDLTVTQDPTTGETFPTIRRMLKQVKEITNNNKQRIIQGIGYETNSSPIPGMDDQNNDPLGLFS